jgi:hypothetical protein
MLKFNLIYDFLDDNGYDTTSFRGFLNMTKERYRELENGAEPTDEEAMAFCDALSLDPSVLLDKTGSKGV